VSSFLILTIGGGAECMFVCLSFVLSEYDDIRLFVDQHCVLSTFVWMALDVSWSGVWHRGAAAAVCLSKKTYLRNI
jgi:hypothetical protein